MKKYISALCYASLMSSVLLMAETPNIFNELAQINDDAEKTQNPPDAQDAQPDEAAPESKEKAQPVEVAVPPAKKNTSALSREQARKEIDAQRDSQGYTTEYTLDPGSVDLVVQLDPKNYGFRGRNHRMLLGVDTDLLLRGRGMLGYDFRFTPYWSLVVKAGIDWDAISLYGRLREQLNTPAPRQFSILAGVTAKWRLTEWYMRSAVFLEPSLLGGYMWQSFDGRESKHLRLRPGLFAGVESIFDSGLTLSFRLGFELPFDFAEVNPVKEVAEPLALFGIGLAI